MTGYEDARGVGQRSGELVTGDEFDRREHVLHILVLDYRPGGLRGEATLQVVGRGDDVTPRREMGCVEGCNLAKSAESVAVDDERKAADNSECCEFLGPGRQANLVEGGICYLDQQPAGDEVGRRGLHYPVAQQSPPPISLSAVVPYFHGLS